MVSHQILERVKSWISSGLALVFPDLCQICRLERATVKEGYVCAACWSRPGGIRFIQAPYCKRCGLPFEGDIQNEFECGNCRELELHFVRARAAVAASGLVREIIHRYKYRSALWFEPFLGDLLIRQAADEVKREGWDLIVPVPLHPLKAREREFNQAERLARLLAIATGLPVRHAALARREATRTQTRLSRKERAANVRHAFAIRDGARFEGERIVLIDDVLTTGATTSECARILRGNGAGEVCVWTVARGL
jgi:ComF family protein